MKTINRRHAFQLGAAALAAPLASAGTAQAADAVRLTFVLVNDIYKMNEEAGKGGLPRLATVVKAEKAKSANVIFAHAGDTLSPSLMSGFDQGAHMMALFNELPPDVFAPGNHEFDFGPEIYLKRMGEARFPVLAANLRDANGAMLPHHADTLMLERGGIRIGLIGATLDASPVLSSTGSLKFAETVATVAAAARALKQQGADITVAVVHADKETGQKLMATRAADIILSGHNHDLHIDFDGRVALTESGEDANYVVAMDVDVTVKVDGATRSVTWWPNYRIFDTKTVTPDPAMLLRVRDYEKLLSQELDVEIGVLGAPLDSATRLVRGGETAIGNLFADALRAQADAEITIMNGGGIRGNRSYPAGHRVTRRDILTELPFGNKTVLTNVTGAQVRAAIENGLSMPGAGRFLQVSGLVITASLTAPVGSRVVSIEVDGKPLDPARVYKLATLDFMVRGGDGYTSLRDPAATEDYGDRLAANDVMAHVRKLGEVSARVEGRIILR